MLNNSDAISNEILYSLSDEIKVKKITLPQVRTCIGFCETHDEHVEQIIEALYQLSILTLRICENEFRPI